EACRWWAWGGRLGGGLSAPGRAAIEPSAAGVAHQGLRGLGGSRDCSWVDVASVARRAKTENFPVASLLFPRRLRPHLRAVYGFARLVDILGDEVEGDRLAALDELELELDACYGGGARVAGHARPPAGDPRGRAPARALCAADRGEPDGPAHLRVRVVVGFALLLRALCRSRRQARARAAAPRARRRARRRE